MNDFNMNEYAELADTGFVNKEPVAPEDEFFHSVYIAGQTRKNHIGTTEEADKIQIRGVEYNLTSVNMIITNVKDILVKASRNQKNEEVMECFSYKKGHPPWKGTSGNLCGLNSAERSSNSFCNICRSQIIVSGIYCDSSGNPLVGSEGKPVFLFIRARGMKYSNVSNYLGDMYKKELPPLFTPETPESKQFEKTVVNNKRFVTTIAIGEASSNYGIKKVFELTSGSQLPNETVKKVLTIAKNTVEKFNEKFDWSLKQLQPSTAAGYGDSQIPQSPPDGILPVDEASEESEKLNSESSGGSFMSFDEVKF